MKQFFARDMDDQDLLVRGLMGLAPLVGAAFADGQSIWNVILLAAAGQFGLFEAARRWCFARACGIKTRP